MIKKCQSRRLQLVFSLSLLILLVLSGCTGQLFPFRQTERESSSEAVKSTAESPTEETESTFVPPEETAEGTSAQESETPSAVEKTAEEEDSVKTDEEPGTEAPTEEAVKKADIADHFGEKYPGAEDIFYLSGFREGIPEGAVSTGLALTDDEAILSYVLDGTLHAAVFSLHDFSFRYYDFDIEVRMLGGEDAETGEWIEYGYESRRILPCGEFLACCYMDEIRFFDRAGTEISAVRTKTDDPQVLDGYAADVSGNVLYLYEPEGGMREIALPDLFSGWVCDADESSLILDCRDGMRNNVLVSVNLSDGTAEVSGVVGERGSVTDGLFYTLGEDSTCTVLKYREESEGFRFHFSEGELPVGAFRDGLLSCAYAYDLEQGTGGRARLFFYTKDSPVPVWNCGLESDSSNLWIGETACVQDRLVFSPNPFSEQPDLVVSDVKDGRMNSSSPAEKVVFEGKGISSLGDAGFYEKKRYDEGKELWTRFGKYDFAVCTDEKVLDVAFPAYELTALSDPSAADPVIIKLKNFFFQLPEGFLDEVIRCYAGFEIFLVDDIRPTTAEGIESVAAFAEEQDNRYYIVIDVNLWGFDSTIPHEFMHMIEHSMDRMTAQGEAFAGWEALNPADFSYFEGYHDIYGNEPGNYDYPDYTPYSVEAGYSVDNIWFIDAYSKTRAVEDRARIFEHAFSGAYNYMDAYDSVHVLAKLRTVSEKLREYFPSLSGTGTAVWERAYKRYEH